MAALGWGGAALGRGRVALLGVRRPLRGRRSGRDLDSLPGEDQVEVVDLGVRCLDCGEGDAVRLGDPGKGVARLNEVGDECECRKQFLLAFRLTAGPND